MANQNFSQINLCKINLAMLGEDMSDDRSTRKLTKREIASTMPEPQALKALAHPERLRMLGLLRLEGPATATQLARRTGLNSGATSYHLRQLARHGFIESADDLGDNRDRWWRARHESTRWDPSELTGAGLEAGMAMTQAVLSTHAQQMQMALNQFADLPLEWKKASNASDFTIALTAEAATALNEKLSAILFEAMQEAPAPGTELDPGMRRYTILLHGFPHPGFPGDREGDSK